MAESMDVDAQNAQTEDKSVSKVSKGKGPAGGKDDPRFVVKKVSRML
jgi:hypothetical protein